VLSSVLDAASYGPPHPAGSIGVVDLPRPVVLSERDVRAFYDPAGRCARRAVHGLLARVAATRVP
jgi:hypothetical protein